MRTILLLALMGCASEPVDSVEEADSVYQWSDDVRIANQNSVDQVGLATLGNHLFVLHTQGGWPGLVASAFDGHTWTSEAVTPLGAEHGPALVTYNGGLNAIYHAYGQNRLLMSTAYDTVGWSSPVTIGAYIGAQTIQYAPAAAVYGGTLYVGYCLSDNSGGVDHLQIDRLTSTGWVESARYAMSSKSDHCKHVAMAALPDGSFDIIVDVNHVTTTSDDWIMYEMNGKGWPSSYWTRHLLTMKSKKPPSIVTCNGVTHLVHGGYSNPDEIWWTERGASGWQGDQKVPDQDSEGGATLGCLANTPIMVHDGGYSDLWWSSFGP